MTNLISLAEVLLKSGQRLLEVHLLPAQLVTFGLEHVLALLLLVEALVVVVDVRPEEIDPMRIIRHVELGLVQHTRYNYVSK